MKQFLLKVSFFVFALVLLLPGMLFIVNRHAGKRAFIYTGSNIKYIVLGHSHPECAYNDTLISNFSNCASSGEAYFYTYLKGRAILNSNPTIDVVLIEFSNNQLTESMNEWIWDDEHLSVRYPRYSPLLSFEDNRLLMQNNFFGYFNALSLSLNRNVNRIIYSNYDFSANKNGYKKLNGSKVDSLLQSQRYKTQQVGTNENISEYNIKYLEKLISYCRQKQKKVFLIRTPFHKQHPIFSNELLYKTILTKRFANVEYLDFKEYPLHKNELYDLEHLNYDGAKKYSAWFNALIRDGLFEQEHKQEFINSRIELANTYSTPF